MITITVRLFAGARDAAGTASVVLSVAEGSPAEVVLHSLVQKYPKLERWKPYLKLAVNQAYAKPGDLLSDGDEVAVIPPVSGG